MGGYKLFIRIDDHQRIIDGYADWQTEKHADDEILVCEDGPRQFHLYWTEPLLNEHMQYRYKWINGQRIERTQEELEAEWAVISIRKNWKTFRIINKIKRLMT
ncbi:hypothetical protein [Cohnella zeiphila]|uniref:Uncharacterized protein n=1 Tax=Cohnella zeiphila TaxID=2761120 RepID=A0A7X0SJQ0_9BACL|nr:hypothetical protein [Cohnella zeiphila]MBB6730064.1 hypothetical protein [Cohnella zeiphila]